jgi:hypothetical protein
MREEKADVVRSSMELPGHPRRRLEERLGLRFPRLRAFLARILWRQPSRRLRWAAARRGLRIAWESFNRDDYEATFMLYRPDTESVGPAVLGTVGVEMKTFGREERIAYQYEVRAGWETLRSWAALFYDRGRNCDP